MAFQATENLCTDIDPNAPETGRVLKEDDPDARFVLAAKGALIDERIAQKFNLEFHDSTEACSADKVRAALVARNEATYATNQANGGALAIETAPAAPVVATPGLTDVLGGVDKRAVKSLEEAGYLTLDAIANASEADLTKLPYVKGDEYDKIRAISNPA